MNLIRYWFWNSRLGYWISEKQSARRYRKGVGRRTLTKSEKLLVSKYLEERRK